MSVYLLNGVEIQLLDDENVIRECKFALLRGDAAFITIEPSTQVSIITPSSLK